MQYILIVFTYFTINYFNHTDNSPLILSKKKKKQPKNMFLDLSILKIILNNKRTTYTKYTKICLLCNVCIKLLLH